MIVNGRGDVLVIERADITGAWQMPQGGLEEEENPLDAAYREIAEETGVEKTDLEFVTACSELLVYELPLEARSKKTGRGQVLYWFLFHFRGNPERVFTATKESRGLQWMPFPRVISGVTSFRRPMYQRLAQEFRAYLEPRQA